jgi:uncharacterized DUF497 family protein
MPRQIFEFDARKAVSNLKKHSVAFAEAVTVFDDPLAETFPDDLHSEDEGRYITIGLSSCQRLLFVSHRDIEGRIRIIGARRANATETNTYEELKSRD